MARSTGVFGLTASKLYIALLRGFFDEFLSLFQRRGVLEPIAADTAHVIHADGRDGSHSRVDLRGADDKTPAAANPKNTNPISVDKRSGAEEIHRCAESFSINIRQNRVAWLPLALSPERLIDSQGDESLISQFLSIQIRTLFLHCTHWVPDYDRGIFRAPIQVFGDEKIPRNRHVVLILKGNLLRSYLIALVEVIRAIGHICSDGDGQCAGSKC
jgi:hypothetical protein